MKRKSGKPVTFSMTPMVDVVMLLIIFFMLTSKFKGEEVEMLSLPSSIQSDSLNNVETKSRFIVNIKPDGKDAIYSYQGDMFNSNNIEMMGKLKNRVQEFHKIYPDGRIVIRADKKLDAKYVKNFQNQCIDFDAEIHYGTTAPSRGQE